MKIGKAPSIGKIDNEIIKALKTSLTTVITDLFSRIIETEGFPKQWEMAEIRIFYKKGNKTNINNYRPICSSSNVNRIFMKVIKNRIYGKLDLNQGIEKAGFRRDFSTIGHINEHRIEVHFIFVGSNNAFDSVQHAEFWQTLANQGIPRKWIKIIRAIYKKVKAYVRTDVKGQVFEIEGDVRQGDPLSPNLFKTAY